MVDVHFGSPAAGPFSATPVRFIDSAALTNDLFGRFVAGSSFAGTSTVVSVIGDSKPDLLMGPFGEGGGGSPRIYIVDGTRLSSITSPADVVTTADVILNLPSGWKTPALQRNGMIRDVDGDGFADFAFGESVSATVGRMAVFW